MMCFKWSFFKKISCNFIDVDLFISNHISCYLKHHITNFSVKKYEGDTKIVGFWEGGSNSQNCENKRTKIATKSLIFIIKLISSKKKNSNLFIAIIFLFKIFPYISWKAKTKGKKYDEVLIKKLMNWSSRF